MKITRVARDSNEVNMTSLHSVMLERVFPMKMNNIGVDINDLNRRIEYH